MKHWLCLRCGQEVMADLKPKMNWDDGHKCVFVEAVECELCGAIVAKTNTNKVKQYNKPDLVVCTGCYKAPDLY